LDEQFFEPPLTLGWIWNPYNEKLVWTDKQAGIAEEPLALTARSMQAFCAWLEKRSQQQLRDVLRQATQRNSASSCDVHYRLANGTTRLLLFRSIARLTETNGRYTVVCLIHDRTPTLELERALHESADMFRQLGEASSGVLWNPRCAHRRSLSSMHFHISG